MDSEAILGANAAGSGQIAKGKPPAQRECRTNRKVGSGSHQNVTVELEPVAVQVEVLDVAQSLISHVIELR